MIRSAVRQADLDIRAGSEGDPSLEDMGTTLVLARMAQPSRPRLPVDAAG